MDDTLVSGVVQQVHAEVKRVIEQVVAMAIDGASLEELEEGVRDGFRPLQARVLEASVRAVGSGNEGPRRPCPACKGTQKHQGNRPLSLVTLVGEIRVRRAYYQCLNCGETSAPLDERLRLSGRRISMALQGSLGQLCAALPFREGVKMLRRLTGLVVCAKTAQEVAVDIGTALEARDEAEAEAVLEGKMSYLPRGVPERLYVTADGAMAHIEGRWQEVKVGAVYQTKRRKGQEGSKSRAEGLSYVAALDNAETFGRRWYAEGQRGGVMQAEEVVAIGDGAAWIWSQVEEHFPGAVEIVDWWHAQERVWEVARCLFGEGSRKAQEWAQRNIGHLRHDRVDLVLRAFERARAPTEEGAAQVREAMTYFRNNQERMRYGTFRRLGYHIGSGTAEAACKAIVGMRLKGPGMRWSRPGARAILHLQAVLKSGRWELSWAQLTNAA